MTKGFVHAAISAAKKPKKNREKITLQATGHVPVRRQTDEIPPGTTPTVNSGKMPHDPVLRVLPVPAPTKPAARIGTGGRKTRVFVVDDHGMVRLGLAALIRDEPDLELCGEAEDCATATSEVARLRPNVVIADISLRGNSGLELIKNIKALDPSINVMVLSVHDESVYALRVLKAGAKGYVMKQDLNSRVIDAVRQVSAGQMYVSDEVGSQMLNHLLRGEVGTGDSPVATLSDRELEVVTLIGSGLATREVAARLNMSVKTVETHRAHIKTKIAVGSSSQLVQFCVRWVEDSKRVPA